MGESRTWEDRKKKEVFTYMTPKLKTLVVEGDDKILKGCETHGENITFSFASLTQPRIWIKTLSKKLRKLQRIEAVTFRETK